jgi:DNA-binding transcriptional ArsR family regulator
MIYRSRREADDAAETLKLFAQPQRLMILSRLLEGECTVGEIETATGIGQPALSQQLATLRRADLVKTRRAAKLVYYRLADGKIERCMASLEAIFGGAAGKVAATVRAGAIAPLPPPTIAERKPQQAGAARFAQILTGMARD